MDGKKVGVTSNSHKAINNVLIQIDNQVNETGKTINPDNKTNSNVLRCTLR